MITQFFDEIRKIGKIRYLLVVGLILPYAKIFIFMYGNWQLEIKTYICDV